MAETLVGIRAACAQASKEIAECAREVQQLGQLIAGSSVYQISEFADSQNAAGFLALTMVLRLKVESSLESFVKSLADIESQRNSLDQQHMRVKIFLLAFGSEVHITPSLTLPHPDLHLAAGLLIPAAEAWDDYIHPVLKKNLRELSRGQDHSQQCEFYAQGKSVLAF